MQALKGLFYNLSAFDVRGWTSNVSQLEQKPSHNNITVLILKTSLCKNIWQKQKGNNILTVKGAQIEDEIVVYEGASSVPKDAHSNERGGKRLTSQQVKCPQVQNNSWR